ncbi:MAG: C13 family peptidase, partial [Nevskiales bacterium]
MIGQYLRTVWAGFRLALLGRPTLDGSSLTPGMIWVFALAGAALSCGLSYLGVEPPRKFVFDALRTEAFDIVTTLLAGFLLAKAFAEPRLIWRLPALLIAAGFLPLCINYLTHDHLLPHWAKGNSHAYYLWYALMLLWWTGILYQALSVLVADQPVAKRVTLSVYVIGLTTALAYPLDHQRFWEKDFIAENQLRQQNQPKPLVAESVFVEQPRLLGAALTGLAAGEPGKTEMYFVGFGGDGSQKVFMREVQYVARQFRSRFGAEGRTLTLLNDRENPKLLPMASVSNLDEALRVVAQRMNVEEDILFLFLTSHGSRQHELKVELGGVGLHPLSAGKLSQLLRESGIRWRIIVVSGCYSGGFIDSLKDERALIITAARADRTSFGCSDTAEFTYFGRAFFEQALNQTRSFSEAFRKAQL